MTAQQLQALNRIYTMFLTAASALPENPAGEHGIKEEAVSETPKCIEKSKTPRQESVVSQY